MVTFHVRRQGANQPVTLPITPTDARGTWRTIVGAGGGVAF